MKTLLVMRHAKSSWQEVGMKDHERPLNERGKRTAPRMGQLIVDQQIEPDVVLCSTAMRAQETATRVVQEFASSPTVEFLSELYLAAPEDYLQQLRRQPDEIERAMVVGHNPGLEQLLGTLTGVDEAMPTAALAVVELEISSWAELSLNTPSKVQAFWRPRELE